MPSIFERLSQQLELMRLEQRYTKRRNRRSTFVSEATYVDGEYVYNIPSPTGSSTNSKTSSTSTFSLRSKSGHGERGAPRANGTDGKRGDSVVVEERVLTPVEDLREAQVIGRERERRWSGISGSWRGSKRAAAGKRPDLVAVRELGFEEDENVHRTARA